jgi:hypothetical protein
MIVFSSAAGMHTTNPAVEACSGAHLALLHPQAAVEQERARHREAALVKAREGASLLWSLAKQGCLRAAWLFTDHTRNALILSVFAFKVGASPRQML